MTTLNLSIDGMTCGHCIGNVRHALQSLPGVHVQDVRLGSAQLHVADESSAAVGTILAAITDAGYAASVQTTGPAAADRAQTGCGCVATSTPATPLTRAHA